MCSPILYTCVYLIECLHPSHHLTLDQHEIFTSCPYLIILTLQLLDLLKFCWKWNPFCSPRLHYEVGFYMQVTNQNKYWWQRAQMSSTSRVVSNVQVHRNVPWSNQGLETLWCFCPCYTSWNEIDSQVREAKRRMGLTSDRDGVKFTKSWGGGVW